jgi:hypothetical protein
MPPPLILLTLPPPLNVQPRPIKAPLPLVRWHLSSRLPLVRRLVVASTSASASRHLLSRSCHTRLSPTPPLCLHQLVVASHLFTPPLPLDAPPPHDWLCCRRCRCAGVVAVDAQASLPLSQSSSTSVAIVVAIVVVVDVRRERARGQRGGIIKLKGRGGGNGVRR